MSAEKKKIPKSESLHMCVKRLAGVFLKTLLTNCEPRRVFFALVKKCPNSILKTLICQLGTACVGSSSLFGLDGFASSWHQKRSMARASTKRNIVRLLYTWCLECAYQRDAMVTWTPFASRNRQFLGGFAAGLFDL